MKNVDSATNGSCVQTVTDLQVAADTFLNPLTYSTPEYLTGSSQGSTSSKFVVAKILKRDSTTGAVTEISKTAAKPAYTGTSSACSIENYVNEVLYRVFYSENTQGLYVIKSI